MAKICPSCRNIEQNMAADSCGSCGFHFFKVARKFSLPMICMQIGSAVFILAILTAVALRFL